MTASSLNQTDAVSASDVLASVGSIAHLYETPEGVDVDTILLPYQARMCLDDSDFRVEGKGRRQGGTESYAFEVAFTRAFGLRNCDVWFSSADESAAREFIERVKYWCRAFNAMITQAGGEELVDGRRMQVFEVAFASGARVTAMASSAKGFRSKGGDVCLDEFAYHEHADEMWSAAVPVISMGFRLTVRSTINSDTDMFWRLIEMGRRRKAGTPRPGDFDVSLHETYLPDAVRQGLVERVNLMQGTSFTREQYIERIRSKMDQHQFEREYLGKPATAADSLLPYQLTRPCVTPDAPRPTESLAEFIGSVRAAAKDAQGVYVGVDIGRKCDRTVFWALARVGAAMRTCGVLVMHNRPFGEQAAAGKVLLGLHEVRRMCVDSTGLGAQLGEQWREDHGSHRVEDIQITAPVKEEIYSLLRRHVEERTVTLPDDAITLGDLASLRMQPTAAGKIRFIGERTAHGHADRACALALALHAVGTGGDSSFLGTQRGVLA